MISHFLGSLFPQMEIIERAVFRVTRDADFEVSDEADDLLEAVELELRRRRFGDIVRLEVSAMSTAMLARLKHGLDVAATRCTRCPARSIWPSDGARRLDRPGAQGRAVDAVTPPASPPAPARCSPRSGGHLVHHPYDSFSTSFEAFVQTAAKDQDVISLKTTVYRTSDETPLVPALMEAAESGKQSVCLVELKARFDERRNIEWSQKLERAGVHVVYGFPKLKIHVKTTLVVRAKPTASAATSTSGRATTTRSPRGSTRTSASSRPTPRSPRTSPNLFNHVTGFGKPQKFRKILVAPFNLRERLIEQIRGSPPRRRRRRGSGSR